MSPGKDETRVCRYIYTYMYIYIYIYITKNRVLYVLYTKNQVYVLYVCIKNELLETHNFFFYEFPAFTSLKLKLGTRDALFKT